MNVKISIMFMYFGMCLAIGGAVIFLILSPKLGAVVGWGCGTATTIFSSGMFAIITLKKRIAEFEK